MTMGKRIYKTKNKHGKLKSTNKQSKDKIP